MACRRDSPASPPSETTVEVPQVQFDQTLGVPVPQTIERLMDLTAAIEQLNTAVTGDTAQQTKDSVIKLQSAPQDVSNALRQMQERGESHGEHHQPQG